MFLDHFFSFMFLLFFLNYDFCHSVENMAPCKRTMPFFLSAILMDILLHRVTSTPDSSSFKDKVKSFSKEKTLDERVVDQKFGHRYDEYEVLKNSEIFVDNTRFIKYFLEEESPFVVIAPRRFGKTTNLQMIQAFFQVPVDGRGNILKKEFEEKNIFFQDLKICKENADICNKMMSKHPVLYFNFNNIIVSSYSAFVHHIRGLVFDLYQTHAYLQNSDILNKNQKQLIAAVLDINNYFKTHVEISDYFSATGRLIKSLAEHFGRKCMILIDEFDSPALSILQNLNIDGRSKHIISLLAKFVTMLLKNNKINVEQGFLTGIMRIGSVYLNEANNLKYHTIFDDLSISQHYGFSYKDVQGFLKKKKKMDHWQEVKNFYDGYYVYGTTKKLFNTYSVQQYLKTFKLERYWRPAAGISFLQGLLSYRKFGKIIDETIANTTQLTMKYVISFEDLIHLRDFLNSDQSFSVNDLHNVQDLVLQYLFENGYYTTPQMKMAGTTIDIIIPNLEIKEDIADSLYTRDFFASKYNLNDKENEVYIDSIVAINGTECSFRNFISSVEKMVRKISPRNEFELHCVLFYVAKRIGQKGNRRLREVSSQFLSITVNGEEEPDIIILRNDNTRIIMEIKLGRTTKGSAYRALKQILDKEYYRARMGFNAKNQIFMGLLVNKAGKCHLSYIYNSKDIKNAVNVTLA